MAVPSPIPNQPYKWLTPQSASWPHSLNAIPNPPQALWCIWNTSLLNSWGIAIVGTRTPSEVGKQTARSIAQVLASEGYTITAGLCKGIDTEAHEGALTVGGKTIAVLVDIQIGSIYPRENRGLARRILDNGGLLIAEHALGESQTWSYESKRFGRELVARDRIQSGLSFCTIPVQAGVKSGTLHTIRSTREQGHGRIVRAPSLFTAREDVQLHPECYAGIHQAVRQGEFFSPADMTYQDAEGEWQSFLEFLRDYRLMPAHAE